LSRSYCLHLPPFSEDALVRLGACLGHPIRILRCHWMTLQYSVRVLQGHQAAFLHYSFRVLQGQSVLSRQPDYHLLRAFLHQPVRVLRGQAFPCHLVRVLRPPEYHHPESAYIVRIAGPYLVGMTVVEAHTVRVVKSDRAGMIELGSARIARPDGIHRLRTAVWPWVCWNPEA
jgi:hypothetical protein